MVTKTFKTSKTKKCIGCDSFANEWFLCGSCNKYVCKDCYIGKDMCMECTLNTKSDSLVKEYYTDKEGTTI